MTAIAGSSEIRRTTRAKSESVAIAMDTTTMHAPIGASVPGSVCRGSSSMDSIVAAWYGQRHHDRSIAYPGSPRGVGEVRPAGRMGSRTPREGAPLIHKS